MLKSIILIFSVFTMLSCQSTDTDSNESKAPTPIKSELLEKKSQLTPKVKKYFDYDEIEYYWTDYKGSRLNLKESKSKTDSLKYGIIFGKIPHDILDVSFVRKLQDIGYKKRLINNSIFYEIDNIFTEKTANAPAEEACIYVYRDVLIFKKNSKVVGVAKICFQCMAHQIKGSEANTENFGQDGDYEKLKKILRP
jgi:hypothetical protein